MKFVIWILGVVCGVILWWGLTAIPAVNNFNNNTHGAISELAQPQPQEETEETGQVETTLVLRALNE